MNRTLFTALLALTLASACEERPSPADADGSGTDATGADETSATGDADADAWEEQLQGIADASVAAAPTSVGVVIAHRSPSGEDTVVAAGLAGPGEPLTPEHALGIGSVTKTYVAAAVLLLAEEGLLSLDDTVDDLLPEIVGPNIDGTITVQQLLGHDSGLADYTEESVVESVLGDPSISFSFDELIGFVGPRRAEPGAVLDDYSNTNYIILGRIIEVLTSTPVQRTLRARIFEPLALNSTFLRGFEDDVPPVADAWLDGISLQGVPHSGIDTVAWTAGGLFSNALDVNTYFASLLAGDVLSASSLSVMTTDELGIWRDEYGGRQTLSHNGETLSYNSVTIRDELTGDLVTVLVNDIEPVRAEEVALAVLDAAAP